MRAGRLLVVASAVALAGAPLGCSKRATPDPSATGAASAPLPVVRDATEGLYFTWIDEKGEFHTEERPKDVPFAGRDLVRVLDPAHEDSEGEIVLADLRNAKPDGSYPVRRAPRKELEDAAAQRRGKRVAAVDPRPADPDAPAKPAPSAKSGKTEQPVVIIYGASWCGPCHQAQAYLERRGIPFVEKDIEEDPAAAREMQAKLKRAGMGGGSIPVLDVKGKILVGFSPGAVEAALRGS